MSRDDEPCLWDTLLNARPHAVDQAPDRLHGLDAVRGYALLLGIVYHATMSFLPGAPIWVVDRVPT